MYNPKAWADDWDKKNPTKIKQQCDDSRIRQDEYQKLYEKKIKDLQNQIIKKKQ
jgi:hypothetical protein